jgi:hypothetical protein
MPVPRGVAAAVAGLFVLFTAWAWVQHLRGEAASARSQARAAGARAAGAERQAQLSEHSRTLGERRDRNIAAAVSAAEQAKDEVEHAQDLDVAIDRYLRGLERVRASGARLLAAAGDHPDGGRPDGGG